MAARPTYFGCDKGRNFPQTFVGILTHNVNWLKSPRWNRGRIWQIEPDLLKELRAASVSQLPLSARVGTDGDEEEALKSTLLMNKFP